MASYFLAPSLVALRNEINARWPKRDKRSDGWIGDPSHAARVSSHNPLWSAPGKWSGVVRAIDVDIDDNDTKSNLREEVIKAAKKDPRVWYIISNGIIYSRTYGFAARKYTGSNGHYGHVHISLRETAEAWSNTAKWFKSAPATKWAPNFKIKSDFNAVTNQVNKYGKVAKARYHGVGFLQHALNTKKNANLVVDGIVGPSTINALKKAGMGATLEVKDLEELQIKYRYTNLPTDKPAPKPPPKPAPKPPAKVEVRVGIHNIYVNRKPDEVNKTYSALLAKHKPHAVLLQETAKMYGKWKIPGYQVIQYAPKQIHEKHAVETSSNTILVRDDVAVKVKELIQLGETWKGPKMGVMHDPRCLLSVTINVEEKNMSLLDVHGPFGKEARSEFTAAIVTWYEERGWPSAAGGDFNLDAATVQKRVGDKAHVTVDGKTPDMITFDKGVKKTGSSTQGKQGSDDHIFKIFDFEI